MNTFIAKLFIAGALLLPATSLFADHDFWQMSKEEIIEHALALKLENESLKENQQTYLTTLWHRMEGGAITFVGIAALVGVRKMMK